LSETSQTLQVKAPALSGILALIAAVVIWGLTFVATKIALVDFQPFTLTVTRLILAWSVLYFFARREGYRLRQTFTPALLALGFTGVAFFYGVETIGLNLTSAASGSLIQAGIPALTAVAAFFLLRERLSPLQIAGVSLSVLGVIVITITGAFSLANDSLLGNLLVLLSTLSWVVYTILGKRLSLHFSPLVATTGGMGAGLLFLLPFSMIEIATAGFPHFTPIGFAAWFYLALGGSALAYFLWNYGLTHTNASVASPFINLIPVIGLFAAILWGEPVSAGQIGGGALAILGIWLSSRGSPGR
jgi:drug/metabolite transporter (DMT)-like permease